MAQTKISSHLDWTMVFLVVLLVTCCISSSSALALTVNKPTEVSWSNRLGVTLTPIATGVWAAERPYVWNSINVGGRSVICRVGDGTLLVHSPVEWTAELGECLDTLGGGVGHVVSPNYEHLKYASQWHTQYPEAKMYACPGLPDRMPEVTWDCELGIDPTPPELEGTIDLVYFDCEINPFTRKPFFNEINLFHVKSKSIIMTDTFWNYPSSDVPNYASVMEQNGIDTLHECPKMPVEGAPVNKKLPSVVVPFGSKLWKFGMDQVYLPFYKKFMVGNGERRPKFNRAVQKVLNWDADMIVPCHGDVIRGKDLCQDVLKTHFYE
mmetsp:Transcript_15214/g.21211  ORF Transcript_15214/g.21211 Transcript_15214/m.21211 type:complete len:323 (+) Transcript_15214:108-1076(+)